MEFVILKLDDGLWVGVGSDHTDRKVESYNVTVSKQLCGKPIAPTLWRYDDTEESLGSVIAAGVPAHRNV